MLQPGFPIGGQFTIPGELQRFIQGFGHEGIDHLAVFAVGFRFAVLDRFVERFLQFRREKFQIFRIAVFSQIFRAERSAQTVCHQCIRIDLFRFIRVKKAQILPRRLPDLVSGTPLPGRIFSALDPGEDPAHDRVDLGAGFSPFVTGRERGDPDQRHIHISRHVLTVQIPHFHADPAFLPQIPFQHGPGIGGEYGIAALLLSVRIDPGFRGEPQIEVQRLRRLGRAVCRHPVSGFVLNHGFPACRPEKCHKIPCRLRAAIQIYAELFCGGIREPFGIRKQFRPVLRRSFRVKTCLLKEIFPPHENTHGKGSGHRPDMFPGGIVSNGRSPAFDYRADRRGKTVQIRFRTAAGFVPFQKAVQRIKKRLPDIGVRHPEIDVGEYIRRVSSGNGKHDLRFRLDIGNGDPRKRRNFDLRVLLQKCLKYSPLRLAARVGLPRVRDLLQTQRDPFAAHGFLRHGGLNIAAAVRQQITDPAHHERKHKYRSDHHSCGTDPLVLHDFSDIHSRIALFLSYYNPFRHFSQGHFSFFCKISWTDRFLEKTTILFLHFSPLRVYYFMLYQEVCATER